MLWYTLEAPRRGASNEYPQHMFSWRNKKKIMLIPPLICSYPFLLADREEGSQTARMIRLTCAPLPAFA